MSRLQIWIIFFVLTVTLAGCTSDQAEEQVTVPPTVSLEEKEAAEGGLIYSPKTSKAALLPQRLILIMYIDAPQAVSEELQALVVGILSGKKPLALVEVNGRGKVVGVGDLLGKYRVAGISKKGVELKHE